MSVYTVTVVSVTKQDKTYNRYKLVPSGSVSQYDVLSLDINTKADYYTKYDLMEYNVLEASWTESFGGSPWIFGTFSLNNAHMKLASLQGPITSLLDNDTFQVAALIMVDIQFREGTTDQFLEALKVAVNNGYRRKLRSVNLTNAQMGVWNASTQQWDSQPFVNNDNRGSIQNYFAQNCHGVTVTI
jgi:hypothetical protein